MNALNVIVAPDSFKGSLHAVQVAYNIALGWKDVRPQDHVDELPMADGGEGTMDAIHAAIPASQRLSHRVDGPDGPAVTADWLLTPDGTAIVEIAQTSGITQSNLASPLTATTTGLGQLMRHVMDNPATKRIKVCLGGSASTDGGSGALAALGIAFTDRSGAPVGAGGIGLSDLAAIDTTDLRLNHHFEIECLVDVTSPLLGPLGAAHMFSPQKGAQANDVAALERGLSTFASVAGGSPDEPGAGAAGGTAYGLATFLDARFVRGANAVGQLYDFADRSAAADIVITGEGRFDNQSLQGKVVGQILDLCASSGTEVGLVAGQIDASIRGFTQTCSLTELSGSPEHALADPQRYLRLAGRKLAAGWRAGRGGLTRGSP